MGKQSPHEPDKGQGPSGFIELGGQMLVVDFGKICHDQGSCGILYEDGFIQSASGPLGNFNSAKPIEEIAGARFRGIDANGVELELPLLHDGPTGKLAYNGITLDVVHGRICDADHRFLGQLDDDGNIVLRDAFRKEPRRRLDDNTMLYWLFQGEKSSGQPWQYEFARPLYKRDRRYSENEIIRYFEGYDELTTAQKKYVLESMNLWARCGLLQIVRKSEGTAALGNVKHGAAGQTGVRTGFVTLDREQFEYEIAFFKKTGPMRTMQTKYRSHVEVRINLVVPHEYGHQLEFVLSQAAQEQITNMFERRVAHSVRLHPPPKGFESPDEIVAVENYEKRVFISGYSRSSEHEYWAEAVAAFSIKESRDELKRIDPELYKFLEQLVLYPEKLLRPVFVETILGLQASLRAGGELRDDILAV